LIILTWADNMKYSISSKSVRVAISIIGGVFVSLGAIGLLNASDNYETYNPINSYPTAATNVIYTVAAPSGHYVGVFTNAWWLGAGVHPVLYPANNGWVQQGNIVHVANLNDDNGTSVPAPAWNERGSYVGGNVVTWDDQCYEAKWWSQGVQPSPGSGSASSWKSLASCPAGVSIANPLRTVGASSSSGGVAASETVLPPPTPSLPLTSVGVSGVQAGTTGVTVANASNIPQWERDGVYLANSVVKHAYANQASYCYVAKWWTQGNEPQPTQTLKNVWDSPWEQRGADDCPSMAVAQVDLGAEAGSSVTNTVTQTLPAAPSTAVAGGNTANNTTPVIPPVIPAGTPTTQAVVGTVPTELPSTGYAFLRNVTTAQWDWLFPLRSGRYNPDGGARNTPPFANPDGSTDVFSLNNFKKAVLAYNEWAKQSGYKQFLNEGSELQQAEEFALFWAKSSRETSGSWSNAPEPWIVNDAVAGTTWKGGLYWVEEVGYTTDATTGKSAAINYVDAGSEAFPPAEGRSYYGRGPIQLSWNYNYGAFSQWMHSAGMFPDVITKPSTLLEFPNLVADNGAISMMSAVWFWMTPQGAKPSSHDVLFGEGNGAKVSQSTQDQGLPQTNDTTYVPKVAAGHTADPEIFSYRIGAIINIVNGGLECNKAAAWHSGPVQRVSYYAAYMKYFNNAHNLEGTIVPGTENVWSTKVSTTSPRNLQNATCYDQKSYYGW
jgi:hypothetical protein